MGLIIFTNILACTFLSITYHISDFLVALSLYLLRFLLLLLFAPMFFLSQLHCFVHKRLELLVARLQLAPLRVDDSKNI